MELIAQHTEIEQLLEMGDSARGAACVALASLLPSCSEKEWHEKGKFARACQRLSGMSKEDLFECLKDVDEQTAEFAPLLKLPVPEQSIMSFLAEK